ncbi:hypothetical protein Syun_022807 [Stephania yunnanensis]|uniref:Uncharacterized protein n=1 Tax=Stephania yunnanensis TaxID=152371 RepID=A0AAP0F8M2_9MAGN
MTKVGEPVGRKVQTTSYRKEKESGRGVGASKTRAGNLSHETINTTRHDM